MKAHHHAITEDKLADSFMTPLPNTHKAFGRGVNNFMKLDNNEIFEAPYTKSHWRKEREENRETWFAAIMFVVLLVAYLILAQ